MRHSKFEPTGYSKTNLWREGLLKTLDNVFFASLVTMHAPAGYGKSTLLAQWYERLVERDIQVAWLNLDEEDRQPGQFIGAMVDSCARAGIISVADRETKACISALAAIFAQ